MGSVFGLLALLALVIMGVQLLRPDPPAAGETVNEGESAEPQPPGLLNQLIGESTEARLVTVLVLVLTLVLWVFVQGARVSAALFDLSIWAFWFGWRAHKLPEQPGSQSQTLRVMLIVMCFVFGLLACGASGLYRSIEKTKGQRARELSSSWPGR